MAKKSTLTPAELKARKAEQDHARYLRNKAAKAAGTTAAKLAAKPDTSAVKPLRPEPKAAKPTLVADPHAHRAQAQAADPAPKA